MTKITANFLPNGLALKLRGQEAFAGKPTRVAVDTRRQHVSIEPFIHASHIGLYTPGRTAVVTADGRLIEELDDPRDSFRPDTAWSRTQLVYFVGHAVWTYFNLPFLLDSSEVRVEPLSPWIEGEETWQVVKVTFPGTMATVASEQLLYFDETGLLRREDYAVEVAGTDPVAHYLDRYETFNGFAFPTRRRIYLKSPEGAPLRDMVIMSADLSDYTITCA
ncbi:hypothetical protein [Luteibacter yeojuensis]|uniref:hypothetical protein n=1 Tax=Luteibacter yeojuensis TaxID=345309 RepID=UPI0012ED591E|nr:hypothetical protein [Luteibacter yeojuensis]